MQSPVKKIHITQIFGVNKSSYERFGLQGHNGIDYRAFLPNGERCYEGGKSEVFAPHSGKIIENIFDANGYGWYIKIEDEKQGSVLAHLSSQSLCKVGETVKMGQFIGNQGSTGNSTGIHLHWGWHPIPRNRANGYNGFENQEGKYTKFEEVAVSTLPQEFGCKSEDELRAKIIEHNGKSWGSEDEAQDPKYKGGYLGSDRRRVKELEGKLDQAATYAGTLDTRIERLEREVEAISSQKKSLESDLRTSQDWSRILKTDNDALRSQVENHVCPPQKECDHKEKEELESISSLIFKLLKKLGIL